MAHFPSLHIFSSGSSGTQGREIRSTLSERPLSEKFGPIFLKSGDVSIELNQDQLLSEWLEHVERLNLLTKDSGKTNYLKFNLLSHDLFPMVQKALYLMLPLAAIKSRYERIKSANQEFAKWTLSLEQSLQLLNALNEVGALNNLVSGLAWRCVQLSEGRNFSLSKVNSHLWPELNRYFFLLYSNQLIGAPAPTFHLQHLLDFKKLDSARAFPQPVHLNLERYHLSHVDTFEFLCKKFDIALELLVSINLSHNELRELPEALLGRCTQLKTFYANDNKIEQIAPNFFKNCGQLEVVDLRNNPLKTLPVTVFSVKQVYADVRMLGPAPSITERQSKIKSNLFDVRKQAFFLQAFRPITVNCLFDNRFDRIRQEGLFRENDYAHFVAPQGDSIFVLTPLPMSFGETHHAVVIDTMCGETSVMVHADKTPVDGWDSAEDGAVLATFSNWGSAVHFHSFKDKKKMKSLTIKYDPILIQGQQDQVTPVGIRLMKLSPNGKKMVVCPLKLNSARLDVLSQTSSVKAKMWGDQARFYNLESNEDYTISHDDEIISIDFSSDSKKAMTVSNQMVKIVMLESGTTLEIPFLSEIVVARFSFAGSKISVLCKDGSVTKIDSEPPLVISRSTFWGLKEYRFVKFLSSENAVVVEKTEWTAHSTKKIDISSLLELPPLKISVKALKNGIQVLERIPPRELHHPEGTFEVQEKVVGFLKGPLSCYYQAYVNLEGTTIFALSQENVGFPIGTPDQISVWRIPELTPPQYNSLEGLYNLSAGSGSISDEQQWIRLNDVLKAVPRFLDRAREAKTTE